jgi:hypothetical protein
VAQVGLIDEKNRGSKISCYCPFNELHSKKSEDYSGLSVHFLKNITLQLLKPLTHVFDLSFRHAQTTKDSKGCPNF